MFYEAINCLLRGNFYQDAYHCYQELFKKQPNFENYTTLTDMIYTGENFISKKTTKQSNINSQKISLLSIFKRKNQNDYEEQKKNVSELAKKSLKNQFPPFQCSSPFEFSEKKLTIDDYINFFLLRLYLYDPVKYEYPSPIIPIPKMCMFDNFGDQDACQTFHYESLMSTEFSLPYFDMNNSRWKDRSIIDIIELNNLLETLYLSYRKELCPSIDNEYSDFDVYHQQFYNETDSENIVSQSKFENLKMKKKIQPLTKSRYSEDSEETEGADDSSSSGHLTSTRYDSKDSSDDDHQFVVQDNLNKQLSIMNILSEPTSPALRLLETGELDDISALLQRLALNVQNNDLSLNNIKVQNELSNSQIFKKEFQINEKIDQIGAKWIKNSNSTVENSNNCFKIENNNDQLLRANIANRLYDLLNANQIQLLYNILEEKD